MEKIGVIAGYGVFPLRVAESLRRLGNAVAVAAIRGECSAEIEEACDAIAWFHVGQIGRAIRFFKKEGVSKAVMAGKVHKVRLFRNSPLVPGRVDLRAIRIWLRLQGNRRDDSLLSATAEEFQKEGIAIQDSTLYVPELVIRKGPLGSRRPGRRQLLDVALGYRMAKEMGRLDIGQSVIVKNGAVIAVEAIEGTDAAIRRAGEIAGPGTVVVKTAKPGQDMRFDVPTIGPDTLDSLLAARAAVLAVEADRTLVLDREEVARRADRGGIAVIAV